ncbi:tyrosine-type recombinase/integrase [Paenibacillus larvae]|uniref:tyrosine-type recombinase/integrase n=1 Tax=Paenibacillus larvae TaxID=1464 RepID=UPI003467B712
MWNEEKETAGQKWEEREHSFIFHNGLGKPFYRTVPSQRWLQFIRANNLPHIRLHDLRHTAATLLLEEGVRLKVIQERHGHANYQTTADIYSHVTKRLTEDAVDKFEKFGPQSPQIALFMIRFSPIYLKRAINLLHQHQPYQLVRHCHAAEA